MARRRPVSSAATAAATDSASEARNLQFFTAQTLVHPTRDDHENNKHRLKHCFRVKHGLFQLNDDYLRFAFKQLTWITLFSYSTRASFSPFKIQLKSFSTWAKIGKIREREKRVKREERTLPLFSFSLSPFSLVPTSTLKERGTLEHAYSVYRLRNSRVNYELAAQICADAHVDDILVQFPNGTIRFCIDVQLRYRRGRKEDLSRITHHLDPNFNFLSCGMKKNVC